MKKCTALLTLLAATGIADATELIFQTALVNDTNSLNAAQANATACGNVNVSFRLQAPPSQGHAPLDSQVASYEAAGRNYYITAGSADYGSGANMMWDSGAMCWNLQNQPHSRGVYLHEVMSGRASSGGSFSDADWAVVGQFASCAQATGKKVVWNEWAGSSWGWQTFLNQVAVPGSTAAQVLSQYKGVFVFLWGDNRDLRQPAELSDMLLAKASVEGLGNATNSSQPVSHANPVQYTFPWGMSAQDWQWQEMGAATPVPASVIAGPVIEEFQRGGRYFDFETYWNAPSFLQGVSEVKAYLRQMNSCASQQP